MGLVGYLTIMTADVVDKMIANSEVQLPTR